GGREKRLRGPAGQRTVTLQRRVAQRGKGGRRWTIAGGKPWRAPQVRDQLPPREHAVRRRKRRERPFLHPHLIHGVAWRLKRKAGGQRVAKRARDLLLIEQWQSLGPSRGSPGGRRAPQMSDPRAEQAVAGLQTMVEEAERPVGGERRQPKRQP